MALPTLKRFLHLVEGPVCHKLINSRHDIHIRHSLWFDLKKLIVTRGPFIVAKCLRSLNLVLSPLYAKFVHSGRKLATLGNAYILLSG